MRCRARCARLGVLPACIPTLPTFSGRAGGQSLGGPGKEGLLTGRWRGRGGLFTQLQEARCPSWCNETMCEHMWWLRPQENENAHLTQVLKELSETRAEAVRLKVLTLESYHRLQVRALCL